MPFLAVQSGYNPLRHRHLIRLAFARHLLPLEKAWQKFALSRAAVNHIKFLCTAWVVEDVDPYKFEGICLQDRCRKLHQISLFYRRETSPRPTGLWVFVRKIDAMNYGKSHYFARTTDGRPYGF